jgi:hypothetical protein
MVTHERMHESPPSARCSVAYATTRWAGVGRVSQMRGSYHTRSVLVLLPFSTVSAHHTDTPLVISTWGDNSRSAKGDNLHQIACERNGKRVGNLRNRQTKGAVRPPLARLG